MLISFLVGFAIGCVIGAIIDLFIAVHEYLSPSVARRKTQEQLSNNLGQLQVVRKRFDREYGDVIDLKAYNSTGEHIANVIMAYDQNTSLYVGQRF